MTYHTFNPEKDTLRVGTKIKLAGREGEIDKIENGSNSLPHKVIFNGSKLYYWFDLTAFPGLQIADEPLKISRRLKEEMMKLTRNGLIDARWFASWLDSLEVTEE